MEKPGTKERTTSAIEPNHYLSRTIIKWNPATEPNPDNTGKNKGSVSRQ